ncbi:MAG: aspartate/glutamate racemase family protein [Dongiaceae bacterium]
MPEWSLPPPIVLAESANLPASIAVGALDHPPLPDGCEIGLIALATDHAIENEMRLFLPPGTGPGGVNLYTTRVPAPDRFGPESLRATEAELARAASLLVPGSRLDVIAYGCTSATAAIGEDAVFAQIRKGRPDIACTSPMTAADAALRRLDARKIVLVTPYPDAVHAIVARDLERRDFTLIDQANFGIDEDSAITRVSPQRIADAVRDRQLSEADAVFVACTSLRTATIVETLENELKMPVISSNRALAWHALALASNSPEPLPLPPPARGGGS